MPLFLFCTLQSRNSSQTMICIFVMLFWISCKGCICRCRVTLLFLKKYPRSIKVAEPICIKPRYCTPISTVPCLTYCQILDLMQIGYRALFLFCMLPIYYRTVYLSIMGTCMTGKMHYVNGRPSPLCQVSFVWPDTWRHLFPKGTDVAAVQFVPQINSFFPFALDFDSISLHCESFSSEQFPSSIWVVSFRRGRKTEHRALFFIISGDSLSGKSKTQFSVPYVLVSFGVLQGPPSPFSSSSPASMMSSLLYRLPSKVAKRDCFNAWLMDD